MLPQQSVAELDQELIGATAPINAVPAQRSTEQPLRDERPAERNPHDRPADSTTVHQSLAPAGLSRRPRALFRTHRDTVLDTAAVALALVHAVAAAGLLDSTPLVVLSLCLPFTLVARRRFPVAVAVLGGCAAAFGFGQLVAIIALGSVAKRHRWGWPTWLTAVALWGVCVLSWPWHAGAGYDAVHHYLFASVVCGVSFGFPVLIGVLLATGGDLRAKIDELATSEANLTALAVERALAEERARIAREMHDVVSHQVALIAMQAGALQVCSDADPTGTAKIIRGLCTKTLDELRALVSTLRSTGGRRLDEVAELAKQSGAQLHLDVDLPRGAVPAPVANAAYRTVQEALTNARKYAPESTKTVSVSTERAELVVEVCNEAPHGVGACELPSGGHGLVGLRERNESVGGRMSAGSTASGGFLVRTSYPLADVSLPLQRGRGQ